MSNVIKTAPPQDKLLSYSGRTELTTHADVSTVVQTYTSTLATSKTSEQGKAGLRTLLKSPIGGELIKDPNETLIERIINHALGKTQDQISVKRESLVPHLYGNPLKETKKVRAKILEAEFNLSKEAYLNHFKATISGLSSIIYRSHVFNEIVQRADAEGINNAFSYLTEKINTEPRVLKLQNLSDTANQILTSLREERGGLINFMQLLEDGGQLLGDELRKKDKSLFDAATGFSSVYNSGYGLTKEDTSLGKTAYWVKHAPEAVIELYEALIEAKNSLGLISYSQDGPIQLLSEISETNALVEKTLNEISLDDKSKQGGKALSNGSTLSGGKTTTGSQIFLPGRGGIPLTAQASTQAAQFNIPDTVQFARYQTAEHLRQAYLTEIENIDTVYEEIMHEREQKNKVKNLENRLSTRRLFFKTVAGLAAAGAATYLGVEGVSTYTRRTELAKKKAELLSEIEALENEYGDIEALKARLKAEAEAEFQKILSENDFSDPKLDLRERARRACKVFEPLFIHLAPKPTVDFAKKLAKDQLGLDIPPEVTEYDQVLEMVKKELGKKENPYRYSIYTMVVLDNLKTNEHLISFSFPEIEWYVHNANLLLSFYNLFGSITETKNNSSFIEFLTNDSNNLQSSYFIKEEQDKITNVISFTKLQIETNLENSCLKLSSISKIKKELVYDVNIGETFDRIKSTINLTKENYNFEKDKIKLLMKLLSIINFAFNSTKKRIYDLKRYVASKNS